MRACEMNKIGVCKYFSKDFLILYHSIEQYSTQKIIQFGPQLPYCVLVRPYNPPNLKIFL